jgi:hypothetical protein
MHPASYSLLDDLLLMLFSRPIDCIDMAEMRLSVWVERKSIFQHDFGSARTTRFREPASGGIVDESGADSPDFI